MITRIICAFIEQLDVEKLGYKYTKCKDTGCPTYDPKMMLNLCIYEYLHHVRSLRRLRDKASRNIEVIWRMEYLKPDDKTICNFRQDNRKALRETFRTFSNMCRKLGLYGYETSAVDGTKIRANNSRKNNHNCISVKRKLARIEKRISKYMATLGEADNSQMQEKAPTAHKIQKTLE